MIVLFAALALAGQNAPPDSAWTWALYADEAPIVLANEIPDSPNLRFTLECEPGSGLARATLYGGDPIAGMARLSAGEASAVAQAETGRGSLKVALPANHPVFSAFAADGRLAVAVGEHRRTVEVPRPHLAKLRRFAELCSG
jgi:hypothetical protein